MIDMKNSLQSILSHFVKVGKVFMPSNIRNGNLGDPEQHYEEFGERRH